MEAARVVSSDRRHIAAVAACVLVSIISTREALALPSSGGDTERVATDGSSLVVHQELLGTRDKPVYIRTAPSEASLEDKALLAEDRRERSSTDTWTIRTGIALAVIGVLQMIVLVVQARAFFKQTEQLQKSVVEAKHATDATTKAASAAQASADALLKIERGYVFATVVLTNGYLSHTQAGTIESNLDVEFSNHGKTPAIIKKLRGDYIIEETAPQTLTAGPKSERELPVGLIIAAGATFRLPVQYRLSDLEFAQLQALEKNLYCLGLIEYQDVLGSTRQTGYCWQYREFKGGREMIITPDTPLNFAT